MVILYKLVLDMRIVGSYVKQLPFIKQTVLTFKLINPTLIFYVVTATIIYILDKVSPSGPCTPGLGVLSFFFLIPIVVALLLRNIYAAFTTDKKKFITAIMHGVAIVLLFVLLW